MCKRMGPMTEIERFPSEPPPSEIDPLGLELPRPDDDFVFAFINSMPSGYRRSFDEDAQHEHAAIAFRRGARAIHVEIWRKLPERIVAIAVVGEDKPGLLSRVSAALVAHDLDVVAAQAYGRKRADGEREAVDLVWIRRLPGEGGRAPSVRSRDVAHIGETLDALARGQASFDGAVNFAHARRSADASTRVRFEQDGPDAATLLLVEAIDRPGLLLVVSRTLFEHRVQIVGSHVMTKAGHVLDRFTVTELDGTPLSGARQLEIQTAVLAALREE
jgi:UTP:GlnB (protein PII) uridylyltransferase